MVSRTEVPVVTYNPATTAHFVDATYDYLTMPRLGEKPNLDEESMKMIRGFFRDPQVQPTPEFQTTTQFLLDVVAAELEARKVRKPQWEVGLLVTRFGLESGEMLILSDVAASARVEREAVGKKIARMQDIVGQSTNDLAGFILSL